MYKWKNTSTTNYMEIKSNTGKYFLYSTTYYHYLCPFFTCEKMQRYFISSTRSRFSPPTQTGQSRYFQLRTMTLNLEMIIFIPAASHSTTNHPRAHWRSWLNEAIMTTSSVKSREAIMQFLHLTPSGLWLRLETLSMKVMNRTGDIERYYWEIHTGKSDIQSAIHTGLIFSSYRDPHYVYTFHCSTTWTEPILFLLNPNPYPS